MKSLYALALLLTSATNATEVSHRDPHLMEVAYDARAVVTVYVKRGVTTHVMLNEHEHIEFVGTGVGSECAKTEDAWCVTWPQKGTQLFVKPKTSAQGQNNIAVATNKRAYSLRFVMVADTDEREPVYRLTFNYNDEEHVVETLPKTPFEGATEPTVILPGPSPQEILKTRLTRAPDVVNGNYAVSVGKRSSDIVPTLVFDDGRFTYFKFPNNREVPAIFHVDGEGQESVVNARMDGDLLVADRISPKFYLRRGKSVVGVFNEAFDLDGVPPMNGTTIPGVARVYKEGVQ